MTKVGDFPAVSTTLKFDPEAAALKRAEVILPLALGPNLPGAQRACPRALADASNCPESSRVGTAIIDSPLQAQPVRGPVYIAFNLDNPLGFPGLMVILPPPVGRAARRSGGARHVRHEEHVRLEPRPAGAELHAGVRRRPPRTRPSRSTRTSARQAPTRRWRSTSVAHNGKELSFSQELATPACDPTAKFTIRRKRTGRRWWPASAPARAHRGSKQFTLRLPKTLSRGKVRPLVLSGGQRMRPLSRKRLASMPFPGEARTATLVWRGLRTGRRLRRTAVIRLAMTDANDKTTSVKRRVRVRGKAPRRR